MWSRHRGNDGAGIWDMEILPIVTVMEAWGPLSAALWILGAEQDTPSLGSLAPSSSRTISFFSCDMGPAALLTSGPLCGEDAQKPLFLPVPAASLPLHSWPTGGSTTCHRTGGWRPGRVGVEKAPEPLSYYLCLAAGGQCCCPVTFRVLCPLQP